MNRPHVSVVIETITTRFDCANGSIVDDLGRTLTALDKQTYPRELIEQIVVIDEEVSQRDVKELSRRYPTVKLVRSPASNYFAAKNSGAAAASGDVIALLDGDCEPAPDWLESLLAPLASGVAAVGGRTRYTGGSWAARTFSIPDFAYVLADESGSASGFNINNVAFPREVLLKHPFDTRISRNGGCYFLFHQLRAEGARILYESRAVVAHGIDIDGFGFARKHFDRGYDGVAVYRLDDHSVLRGTRLFRRLGGIALVPIIGRRILVDWMRLLRHRRQIGISFLALPYFAMIAFVLRSIELTGGLTAVVTSKLSTRRD
jgi:glycosyltransferase involved in cell wall biosynthesis